MDMEEMPDDLRMLNTHYCSKTQSRGLRGWPIERLLLDAWGASVFDMRFAWWCGALVFPTHAQRRGARMGPSSACSAADCDTPRQLTSLSSYARKRIRPVGDHGDPSAFIQPAQQGCHGLVRAGVAQGREAA